MLTKRDYRVLGEVAEYHARFGKQEQKPTMDEFHGMITDGWNVEDWPAYIRRQRTEARMDADQVRGESLKWFRIAVFLLGMVILLALTLGLIWPF